LGQGLNFVGKTLPFYALAMTKEERCNDKQKGTNDNTEGC